MSDQISQNQDLNALQMSKLIVDEYSAKILSYAKDKPRSVLEMCEVLGIPMTLGYRRVNALTQLGLMNCQGRILTQNGKWMKIYMSKVNKVFIYFENGKLRMKLELKTGEERWTEDWFPRERQITPAGPIQPLSSV